MKKYRKKSALMTVLVLFAALALTGCGGKVPAIEKVESSMICLSEDGAVNAFLVEEFQAAFYDETELEEMIRQETDDYNAQAKAGEDETLPVQLVDILTRQEQADAGKAGADSITVQMAYASAEDYGAFNDTVLYLGTVDQAKTAGYPILSDLTSVSDGSTLTKAQAQEMGESHILILQENIPVQVPWKVLYTSAGVTVENKTVTFEGTEGGYAYVIMK